MGRVKGNGSLKASRKARNEGFKVHSARIAQLRMEKNAELDANDELRKFKGRSVLKRAAMNVLVKHMNPKDIRGLTVAF